MGKCLCSKKPASSYTPISHREVSFKEADAIFFTDKDIEMCNVLPKDIFIAFGNHYSDISPEVTLSTPPSLEKKKFYKN
ncbi:MAG: hypothetical protein WC346_15340 [Methanogenium sp.]|jgi:hypothetical protein